MGVIGLGAGTVAYYARKGDHYTFYELDPDVVRIAEERFTYTRDARARGAIIETKIGDARVQLTREDGRRFDVLIVDAFSSDAIPVHLLTRECNRMYWSHLEPDGLMLVHISNRHLDLRPVVRALAQDVGRQLRVIVSKSRKLRGTFPSHWAIVTGNADVLARREMQVAPDADRDLATVLWTDDFSSLWHVLK